MATSQMCNLPSGNFPKVRPSNAPQVAMKAKRCGWRPSDAARRDWSRLGN